MRTDDVTSGPLKVRAIAGTHVILMAFDVDPAARDGLRGFAIRRSVKGSGEPPVWLKGIKYFKDLVPNPIRGAEYLSRDHPFQSFLWSDYAASPGTSYELTIVALYGDIGRLEERYSVTITVTTEQECADGHGIWFNRGAIASHALATQFQNTQVTAAMFNDVDASGQIRNPEVKWLSRGLAEACIDFINAAKTGEGLRVCAYEFTYQPVLQALKRALDRGVDVQIIYHWTKKDKDPNAAAISAAKLPKKKGTQQILYTRTRTKIPHNKFIVKLVGNAPIAVWTGSTNFTDTGFLGQTNVGHLVLDPTTAGDYLKYWTELSSDPVHSLAMKSAIALTPNPPNVIKPASIVDFFSPRVADNMLDWFGQRIENSAALALMTIPFNVAPAILNALAKPREALRLVILEDPRTKEVTDAEKKNRGNLAFSNGAILGKTFIKYKTQFGGAKVTPITTTPVEKWFVDEEMARPINSGHVFFVHSKVLIIDPLSDDPLVCSGSANFSTGSLISNDENILLIRGNKRVADIYLTEFDRIFRHFYARDAINDMAIKGNGTNPLELDTTNEWVQRNVKVGSYKNNRRQLFFPPSGTISKPWSVAAAGDKDPFADEQMRAATSAKKKNDAAKARRAKTVVSGKKSKTVRSAKKGAKKTTKANARKSASTTKKKTVRKGSSTVRRARGKSS